MASRSHVGVCAARFQMEIQEPRVLLSANPIGDVPRFDSNENAVLTVPIEQIDAQAEIGRGDYNPLQSIESLFEGVDTGAELGGELKLRMRT